MKNDTKKEELYFAISDLACERRRADVGIPGIEFSKEICPGYTWERLTVTSDAGAKSIGRPMGRYDTLTLQRMETLGDCEIETAAGLVGEELEGMIGRNFNGRLLVVGLGNSAITADAVGPKVAASVKPTKHIKELSPDTFAKLDCAEISVVVPGVMATSGLDAYDIVSGICERTRPDLIIAIDALAARSEKRLGRTIQISNTGIFPGSGIGGGRTPLNEKTLGIPVFAVGVPTVINAAVFKEGLHEKGEGERKNTEAMFVSPKEIDDITVTSAKIIALGINKTFGIV